MELFSCLTDVSRCSRFALLTGLTSEYESMHQKLKSSHVLKVTCVGSSLQRTALRDAGHT